VNGKQGSVLTSHPQNNNMFIPIFSQPLHTDENGTKYWRDDALNAYCKSVGVAAYVWIIETQSGRRSRILVNTNGDILEDSPDMDTISSVVDGVTLSHKNN
jgi:hypothetical protein